jgi:hypothetical protein
MVIAITEECMVFKLSIQKPPNKRNTVALPELPPVTHLAVAEGCGGTSLALQYARNILKDGGRVIWVCEKSPDSGRFSQILCDIDVVSLAKFHMMECGETISGGVLTAGKLAEKLTPELFVVDDWTPRTGQPDRLAIAAIESITKILGPTKCKLLITSALYSDASGKEVWKTRGKKLLEKITPSNWMLTIAEGGLQKRILRVENEIILLQIRDKGFS